MSAFNMLRIASEGLGAHQVWLDAIGNNISNVNTYKPTSENAFQVQYPIFQADSTGGVRVTGIAEGDPNGRMVSMPDNPLADANGYVRAPDEDLSAQMGDLIMAQRGFQASVSVTKTAQDVYQAAIAIGQK
ncbi:flagellar basal body rod protein FlgC [Nocardioides nematodiphilus]|jgi:flagellar basal-body rod protein FlgC|uniref:flagellar basal body rod protein FlgC n=1 Tax=Nocardioides nematodiphilus TaxID=2849669 RepID=UPI001CDA4319|nr:flagellar basal body protein [Nocardioides nematodiphilus]MCA1984244.1 flagellar basal body protein [Nocardioides nematodiphilus]